MQHNNGILCGNAGIKVNGLKQWKYFISLFNDKIELEAELREFFENVVVLGSCNEDTLFFMASNRLLPGDR